MDPISTLQTLYKKDAGVSTVVGVILLTGVVVVAVTTAGAFLIQNFQQQSSSAPLVELEFEEDREAFRDDTGTYIDYTGVTIKHKSGEPVSELRITVGSSPAYALEGDDLEGSEELQLARPFEDVTGTSFSGTGDFKSGDSLTIYAAVDSSELSRDVPRRSGAKLENPSDTDNPVKLVDDSGTVTSGIRLRAGQTISVIDEKTGEVIGTHTIETSQKPWDCSEFTDDDNVCDADEGTGDIDGDGDPNWEDDDTDGDGIPDNEEGDGDADGDGVPNYKDTDSDGDGLPDDYEYDGEFEDPEESPLYEPGDNPPIDTSIGGVPNPDVNNDGTPNYLSTDSDGDGIPDDYEHDGSGVPNRDEDGDGKDNFVDEDSDNDGISDDYAWDGPGVPTENVNGDPKDNFVDEDSDGDGIPDRVEGKDDVDGDNRPNFVDLDSDGDYIPDEDEYDPAASQSANKNGNGNYHFKDDSSSPSDEYADHLSITRTGGSNTAQERYTTDIELRVDFDTNSFNPNNWQTNWVANNKDRPLPSHAVPAVKSSVATSNDIRVSTDRFVPDTKQTDSQAAVTFTYNAPDIDTSRSSVTETATFEVGTGVSDVQTADTTNVGITVNRNAITPDVTSVTKNSIEEEERTTINLEVTDAFGNVPDQKFMPEYVTFDSAPHGTVVGSGRKDPGANGRTSFTYEAYDNRFNSKTDPNKKPTLKFGTTADSDQTSTQITIINDPIVEVESVTPAGDSTVRAGQSIGVTVTLENEYKEDIGQDAEVKSSTNKRGSFNNNKQTVRGSKGDTATTFTYTPSKRISSKQTHTTTFSLTGAYDDKNSDTGSADITVTKPKLEIKSIGISGSDDHVAAGGSKTFKVYIETEYGLTPRQSLSGVTGSVSNSTEWYEHSKATDTGSLTRLKSGSGWVQYRYDAARRHTDDELTFNVDDSSKSKEVFVDRPDLRIESIGISGSDDHVAAGGSKTFKVYVETEFGDTPAQWLTRVSDNVSDSTEWHDWNKAEDTGSLTRLRSGSGWIEYRFNAPDRHAENDLTFSVDGSSESKQVFIDPPDLKITDVDPDDTTPEAGDTVHVDVDVETEFGDTPAQSVDGDDLNPRLSDHADTDDDEYDTKGDVSHDYTSEGRSVFEYEAPERDTDDKLEFSADGTSDHDDFYVEAPELDLEYALLADSEGDDFDGQDADVAEGDDTHIYIDVNTEFGDDPYKRDVEYKYADYGSDLDVTHPYNDYSSPVETSDDDVTVEYEASHDMPEGEWVESDYLGFDVDGDYESVDVDIGIPGDPNAIHGTPPRKYVRSGEDVNYTVQFENNPNATVPAEDVNISVPVDEGLNASAIEFGNTSHPDSVGTTTVSNGTVNWKFDGINLPPNSNSTDGDGYIRYQTNIAADASNGTRIDSQAGIVFDLQEPVMTNNHTYIVDETAPESTVSAEQINASDGYRRYKVTVNSTDPGIGVDNRTLYTKRANGSWKAHKTWDPRPDATNTSQSVTTTMLVPKDTKLSLAATAVDEIGNEEERTGADATIPRNNTTSLSLGAVLGGLVVALFLGRRYLDRPF
jgi:hypothetical protein